MADKEFSEFQKITRVIFKLLRTYHCWGPIRRAMVGNGPIPKNIAHTRDWLVDSLRPALPKGTTADLLDGNATNWLQTGLKILNEHYQSTSAELQRALISLPKEDGERAWAVASRWLRLNYPHAKDLVFDLARADLDLLGLQLPVPGGPDPINPEEQKDLPIGAGVEVGSEDVGAGLIIYTPALFQATPPSSPDIPLPSTQPSPRSFQPDEALAVSEILLEGSPFKKTSLGMGMTDPLENSQEVDQAGPASLLLPLGLQLGVENPVASGMK
ncbi:hypothetical protein JOQ06_024235 [Pogonophryne albipinna]|uniref:Uncharacterized protein n=1 Tax=Pogonophryne albipinna TaxID=1090488 RepID=A0AAD6BKQ5_9TELE|nr:hypothetical protein JOQ06_024235 [Pogonophryne albipinna]